MNKFLVPCWILLLTLAGQSCKNSAEPESLPEGPYKPNVLLILTDDQGWGDISSHGNDTLQTPNLDKLASESFRFERFYVSPLCAPTRASLLTGRYHLRTGVDGVTRRREVMRNTELTLAELFRTGDYNTSIFGKWHNGAQYPNNPAGQGFDHFFGFCAGHWNNYFDTQLEYNGEMVGTRGYIADVLTDSAISKIRQSKTSPFFLYMAYNTPHTPYQVPDRYFNKYSKMGLSNELACIYGMVENIDDNVGRLMLTLDEEGLSENTIVIFMTDNGPNGWRYNGNMKGKKGWVDEGGVRVPLFMKIPWLSNKEVFIKGIAAHIDIFPTLASLCKLEIPDGLRIDGIDLSGYLVEIGNALPDRYIYTQRGLPGKIPWGLRSEKYLLTLKQDTLLFNLQKDPSQKEDISVNEPGIVKEYIRKYDNWYTEVTAFGLEPPPIELGYINYPRTLLPAPESSFTGGIEFKEGHGWANDWIINFRNPEDEISWKVKVMRNGTYDVTLRLDSPATNKGRELNLSRNILIASHKIDRAYISRNIDSPDRVKRKEVYQKEWPEMNFGEVYLEKGIYDLKLTTGMEGLNEDIEIMSMIITLKTDKI